LTLFPVGATSYFDFQITVRTAQITIVSRPHHPMNTKRLTSFAVATVTLILSARADITTGLRLYFNLDETSGSVVNDSSGNGNNGAIQNFTSDPVWTNGWINGALFLTNNPSGLTNYILIPDAATLNFTNENAFTLAAWIKMPNAQRNGSGIFARGSGNGGEQYVLDVQGNRYRLLVRNAGKTAVTLSSTVAPANNVWQHVAAVYDGANSASRTMRIYLNGLLNTSTTNTNLTSLLPTNHVLTIGARRSSSASGSAFDLVTTNTALDEVRIYNRPLSASDVYELYSLNGRLPALTTQPRNITNYVGDYAPFNVAIDNNNSTLPVGYQWKWYGTNIPNATNALFVITNVAFSNSGPYSVSVSNVIGITNSSVAYLQVQSLPAANIFDNLAGYWKFDEASGSSTAADSSANANTGALIGFADISSCWVGGLTNGALNFNGDASTADLVAIPAVGTPAPAVLDFNASPALTLAAWVKASLPQTNGAAIICKGAGGGGEQYAMDLSNGTFRFYARDTNGAAMNLNTSVPVNGTWQHVAAVLDVTNGIMNYYVNGQLVGVTIPPASLNTNNHEVSIGNRQSGAATPYNLPFSGAIDDVRIYARALNSADIQALYATGGLFPPSFATQPQGGSAYVGEDFKLTASVGGTVPIAFQWKTNGVNIPGATNSTLLLTNLQLASAGTYTLLASNAYGTALSSNAVLQVTNFFLTNLLAGWWKFDDATGSTAADSSPNGNVGSLINFAIDDSEWVMGRRNGALSFNPPGVTNYVFVNDAPSLNFNTTLAFTLSAWVRSPIAQLQSGPVLCKGTGGGGEHYCIDFQNGFWRFFCRTATGTAPGIVTTNPPTGFWQLLTVTFDGNAGFMRFYVDGQLVGTNAAPNSLNTTFHELTIGCRQSAAAAYNLPFNGQIDDVRIYSRALSTYDVAALYAEAAPQEPYFYAQPHSASRFVGENVSFAAAADGAQPLSLQWQKDGVNIPSATNFSLVLTNLQLSDAGSYSLLVTNALGSSNSVPAVLTVSGFNIANTVAYYRFDETTGSTAADSSGNGNIGTLINMPFDDSEWIPGRISGALSFNADFSGDDYVSVPDASSINFNANPVLSIAAWVRGPGAQTNGAGIVVKGTGSGGEQYAIDVNINQLTTPAYRFYVRSGAGPSTDCTTPVVPNGRWQHIAAVYNGPIGLMQFYVNGQLVSSVTGPTSLLPNTHELSLGSRQSGAATPYDRPFTGVIDDVRLYNHALSSNEVQQIYALAAPFGPVVYTQPQSSTKYVHDSISLSAVADGTDPLTLQWKKNGSNVPGATGTSLPLPDLQFADAGNYSLAVTNPIGFTNSSTATLAVLSLPPPDLTNELIAYWTFDETNGVAAADSSGRGNSASLFEFPVDDSQWVPGVIGGALHFSTNNGAGNYRVGTDNSINFDNGNLFTFSFWAKRDPGPTGTNPRFFAPVSGQSWVGWTPGRGVGFLTPAVSSEPVSNAWHHFAVTYDRLAGSYSLYVDGVRQVSNATGYARNDPTVPAQYWFIGHSENFATTTDSFTGLLDDVRIYNRLLNFNDIQALFLTGGQPRLIVTSSGSSITLSWPLGALGFNLYTAGNVSGGPWTPVGISPTISSDGATQSVTVTLTSANKFYRLQKP
jgi:hypothetical protein